MGAVLFMSTGWIELSLVLLDEAEGVAEGGCLRALGGGRLASSMPSNIKRGCFCFLIDREKSGELKTDNSERGVNGLGGCVLDMVLLQSKVVAAKRCYRRLFFSAHALAAHACEVSSLEAWSKDSAPNHLLV